jgi:hypothetical protein
VGALKNRKKNIYNNIFYNDSFERVEEFRYLGNPLTNQKFIQVEIKSRLKSGNACCRSAQNLLSSSLLSKNLMLKYTEL